MLIDLSAQSLKLVWFSVSLLFGMCYSLMQAHHLQWMIDEDIKTAFPQGVLQTFDMWVYPEFLGFLGTASGIRKSCVI